jgi:bifunctional DNA-binding transcriptional regulator/antitoxin component of YhaV-PrlF toxin-antitoxin module
MSQTTKSRITAAGLVVLPPSVQERLGVKPGDEVVFDVSSTGAVTVSAPSLAPSTETKPKRSIFDGIEDMLLPSLGRPLTQADIDDAVGEAMIDQERRIRNQR